MSLPRTRFAVVVLSSLLVLSACSDGGIELPSAGTGDPTAPTDPPAATDPPEATDPPATEAPATDPPATEAPATDPPAATDPPTTEPEDDGDGISPEAVLLIILGILALGGIAALLLRRRPAAQTPSVPPATDPRRQFVATGRWMHDSLSLEILAMPAAEAQARWAVERSRFDQLVIDLRAAAPVQSDPVYLESLANSVSNLQSSLDTAVRIRATPDADATVVQEAIAAANGRRGELQRALVVTDQWLAAG